VDREVLQQVVTELSTRGSGCHN